jgi:hypothetical protein
MRVHEVGIAGVLLLALFACATRWQTESTTAPAADLSGYASFGWQPASESASEAPLSITDAHLRDAIRSELVEKGYREVERDPDLQIGFETTTRSKEKVSPPVRIGVGVGSWGGNVGGGVGGSVPVGSGDVTTTSEARITIRAVDPKAGREVWLGTATGEVKPGSDPGIIQEAVAAVLEDFPAARR